MIETFGCLAGSALGLCEAGEEPEPTPGSATLLGVPIGALSELGVDVPGLHDRLREEWVYVLRSGVPGYRRAPLFGAQRESLGPGEAALLREHADLVDLEDLSRRLAAAEAEPGVAARYAEDGANYAARAAMIEDRLMGVRAAAEWEAGRRADVIELVTRFRGKLAVDASVTSDGWQDQVRLEVRIGPAQVEVGSWLMLACEDGGWLVLGPVSVSV